MSIINDMAKWRFWRHFVIKAFACGGGLSAILQLENILFPQITFQGSPTLIGILSTSLVAGLVLAWPRPIAQTYSAPNTRICIVKGDILKQEQHLVIGTCDTFDTETPVIIAKSSLQGQVLDVLFGGDLHELDKLLSEALKGRPIVKKITKEGKQDKYEIGTVATIKQAARRLFFVAYCEMNERNEARGTVDSVWKSLLSLWAEISAHGNGAAVCISVLGGGQARLSSILPAQDSIRLIALSFMFASRNEKICDELRIVVRPNEYEQLDRLEIQSFLSSLRPS